MIKLLIKYNQIKIVYNENLMVKFINMIIIKEIQIQIKI